MKLAHINYLGLNARRPIFGVYDHVRLKPTCSVTASTCSWKAEIYHVASLSIILSRGWTTKALIRLRGCVGWSTPLIFECNYVRFSLDTTHNCHYNNCIVFQCFTPWLGRAQRALLMIASINWKSEVSTKKNEPKREKKDTAESILVQKSGPALAVLPDRRRRPWCLRLQGKWYFKWFPM